MNLYFSIFTKLMLFLPIFAFSQTSIGPLIGYDIASINVGKENTPLGPPQTKGFENGSFLYGLKIARKFKDDYLFSIGSFYTKKKVGGDGVWSGYLSYFAICNSLVIEKQLKKSKKSIYLGVGLAHKYNGGFNYNLPNQSSSENHLGMVMSSSCHFKSLSFCLRYGMYWNLISSDYEHILSSKSFEFSASYMFELFKK